MNSDKRFELAGIGEILWDMLPGGKQLGGAPANFAYHAQALGARGVAISQVGKDELGQEILDQLDTLGLDRQYIAVDDEHATGTVSIQLDENGKPDYIIHQNVAWDFIPSLDSFRTLAARADAVCFGSLCQRSPVSRATIRNLLSSTKPPCLRILDINLRQSYWSKEIIHDSLALSNILKLNDDELPAVANVLGLTGSQTNLLEQLRSRYELQMIALTKGEKGSVLFGAGQTSSHNGFSVEVADTVGAGDAFTAALALGLLHERDLDRINEHACRVASFVCSQHGATPELPTDLLAS